mmetsp:Transcript_8324/g.13478  ORF Transcript_8324/g.13478 Transcript_8324/m.13478 type:complete len:81 (-) Transcript_8324:1880-2122(-)
MRCEKQQHRMPAATVVSRSCNRSCYNAEISALLPASPIHPRRSSLCGQSVGMDMRLEDRDPRAISQNEFTTGFELLISPC